MTAIETPKSQYQQVADLLRQRIQDGTYAPGSALPSEPELATEFGLSRVTVNKAITLLRSEGVVKVKRGSGTYVREVPRIYRDARKRFSTRRQGTGAGDVEVRALGLRPRTEYLEIGKTSASPEVAEALQLHLGADVLVRRRRLTANDEPTQIADSYYPWSIVGDTRMLEEDLGAGGSYSYLAELGHGPVRFTEDVTVGMATDAEARALELDGAQAVIRISHISWTAEDRPIEVMFHVMPGFLWTLHYEWDDESAEEAT